MAVKIIPMTFLVMVPKIFWDDHVARDLDFTSTIIKESGAFYQVLMTIDAINELWSDADYYGNFMKEFENDGGRSICASARATVRALENR